jgi:hypothetical protein
MDGYSFYSGDTIPLEGKQYKQMEQVLRKGGRALPTGFSDERNAE